jgi:hypothetical protein
MLPTRRPSPDPEAPVHRAGMFDRLARMDALRHLAGRVLTQRSQRTQRHREHRAESDDRLVHQVKDRASSPPVNNSSAMFSVNVSCTPGARPSVPDRR